MKLDDADVVWTPGTDLVRVEIHGSGWERSKGDRWMPAYSLSQGGMGAYPRSKLTDLLGMFVLFNTITVRDGVSVEAAHRAFLNIEEYSQTISPDSEGSS